jgi:hypothetical protein
MSDAELQQIYEACKDRKIKDSEALARALPLLRGRINDKELVWLAQEIEGYGGLSGQSKRSPVPPDRQIYCDLKAIIDGKIVKVSWGPASDHLVGLMHPLSELEAELNDPCDYLVLNLNINVDAPELHKRGPLLLCCHRGQLERIVARFHKEFLLLLEQQLGS